MNYRILKPVAISAVALIALTSGAATIKELAAGVTRGKLSKEIVEENVIMRPGNFDKGASVTTVMPAATLTKAPRQNAEASATTEVLIDEDFSLWTDGSREDPIYLGDLEGYFEEGSNYNLMPDKMSNGKRWGAMGACSADQACGLTYPNLGGMIQTSAGNYSGKLTITIKAKMMEGQPYPTGFITASVCKNWENAQPAQNSNYYTRFYVPNDGEWHDFEWVYENAYGGDDCFVQFNSNFQMLVDDIKIVNDFSTLGQPILLPATDFTNDGFTANWEPVGHATDYLLSCWRNVPLSDENITMTCDFEGINHTHGVINGDNPNFPDGWEFDFKSGTPTIFTPEDEGFDSNAFCFDTEEQSITTPFTGSPIIDANVKIRFEGEHDEYGYPGQVLFYGYDGHEWEYIAGLYMDEDFDGKFLKMNLTEEIPMLSKYYRLRFYVRWLAGSKIAFDDINITTLPLSEREYAFEKKAVDGTSYVVTGLAPESDYYYTVSARNTELGIESGEPTNEVFAFGIMPVKALAPTDIQKSGAYTANWEVNPKAQEYTITNYSVYTAKADEENHVAFDENFSKCVMDYTIEDPYLLNNFYTENLDAYCDNAGWYGVLNGFASQAVGGIGYYEYQMCGALLSPTITLNHNDGKYTVKVSACGTPGDLLVISNANGYSVAVPLTADFEEHEVEMENGQAFDTILFSTQYKTSFFLNHVQVLQNLKEGEMTLNEQSTVLTEDTSCTFSDLKGTDYAYMVRGIHRFLSEEAYSDASEIILVDLTTGLTLPAADANVKVIATVGGIMVEADANTKTDIYTTDGLHVASFTGSATTPVANGIYIVKCDNRTYKLIVK